MTAKTLHGNCLCGAIRYEISAPLGVIEHCHCSMCRKAHGAAFSTNAVVSTVALTITTGVEFINKYESSPNRQKSFCAKCGSQLFIRRLDKPEFTVVTLGTLNDDPDAKPERHVFVDSKAVWYDIEARLPQFRIYPGFEPD
jgi:hypothetical protein